MTNFVIYDTNNQVFYHISNGQVVFSPHDYTTFSSRQEAYNVKESIKEVFADTGYYKPNWIVDIPDDEYTPTQLPCY